MSIKKQKSVSKKFSLSIQIFFRRYPSTLYLLRWLLITLFIGTLIGSASAFFLQTLDWATNFRENHLWLIALLPIGGFLIGLLYYYLGKDIEAGNNLLIDTIHDPKQIIPFRMAPFVYIGTIATHFFGGSAGREGTALQMAGAIADQFSKPFRLNAGERAILIIAAIAAGFGSVFGTPLAGALFGLEVFLIGRIRYNAIFPAFAASIIADLVTKMWQTHHTHYHISFIPDISFLNILYAIMAGIFFGLCASAFSKIIHWAGRIFKSKISYPPLRPFVGGIIVTSAVWIIGTTKYIGLGIPTIVASFDQQLPAYDFALKMLFTIVTLSAGFKGGEVTPLFFIGATLGNALSYFIPLPPGLLAGMGFVAVFAGATNTPIACMIMAIELFGSECGVYVAIACVVAYLLSGNNSIYGKQMIGDAKNPRFMNLQGKRLNDL
ncbi:voltage-gated chloride channel family protein [Elizabethkingia anophelis]|uniref:voltage-gated chloride channel family protein n=1 Tax=Elizabethkingia anophelis TaxID=1117645 RepID=UPI0012B37708|nr:voltage-gated chloride channel family protein [Elizabethkingia anophelis]MCT3978979.1 voltage-gated chloride channel family protein [Elizabethkingia anophelis]MDV4013760.1 chloride channel protein [Elizabethkingia anophelis]MVW84040.1 chloride channel protein [Elizabethkingia anophelis]QGN23549.1 chloride channel protein [Elizabethkingia anophelis]QNV10194.1 chloride channel protein [Elizabethkingia anophelis]